MATSPSPSTSEQVPEHPRNDDWRDLIDAQDLDASALGALRLLDVRSGDAGRRAYAAGHLAGALHADLDRDLAAPKDATNGGRHPLPDLGTWGATLGRWGIRPETGVVAYDDQGGANAAARLWWMMRATGHRRVAILDGGFAAALRAGVPATADIPTIEPAPPYPVPERWQRPTVTADEVERAAGSETPVVSVVDVRSPERFRGEVEPFDPVAGHIPGAVNLPYAQLLDDRGRFLPRPDLARLLDRALGDDSGRTIVHCGSGVTACHLLFALELAGRPPARLYVGSWSEWCRSGRPVATGPGERPAIEPPRGR